MSSRTTRNKSKNQQTPSPSPSGTQASPRAKARKSFTKLNARAPVSTPANIPSTSRAGKAEVTGGGPAKPPKKVSKRVRSSSSEDSAALQSSMTRLMRGRSSTDSEDDDQPLSQVKVVKKKPKPKQARKKTQAKDSSSEGSDDGYVPPAKGTAAKNISNSVPSSTSSQNDRGRTSVTALNTSQDFGARLTGSSQTGFLKNLINKCVFYILVADQKKHAIKKIDILKNVFEDSHTKDTYHPVLKAANEMLKKTFGLELLTLQNQKNSYILINILDQGDIQEFADYSEDELQKKGLIYLLLTIIYMNQNTITEDKLWKALEATGLNPSSSVPHPVFGNIKRCITSELVKEMYLEYTRVNKDPIVYEFTWGERAYQEVQKMDLLNFACEIMGDSKPEDWKLQFIDAKPKPVNGEA